jgi:hypothetical protein
MSLGSLLLYERLSLNSKKYLFFKIRSSPLSFKPLTAPNLALGIVLSWKILRSGATWQGKALTFVAPVRI